MNTGEHPAASFAPGRLPRSERGGIVVQFLLVFMVLTVPVVIGAITLADQLSVNSRTYEDRLEKTYNASAGIEEALWQLLNDPAFADGLTPESPSRQSQVTVNGEAVQVTATEVFGSASLQGQAIIVSKTVTPTSAAVGVPTTFTYTITVANSGTQAVTLKEVHDYMPPRLAYQAGSTSGLTTDSPAIAGGTETTCGATPTHLYWDVQGLGITLAAGTQVTLMFSATGTLVDGAYYNQASVRYAPWWTTGDVYVYSPFTAPITVGAGVQECGFAMRGLISKAVEPSEALAGVPTEFTYTISVKNTSASALYICMIDDLLPPTYSYVNGSSDDDLGNITLDDPQATQQESGRWDLVWPYGYNVDSPALASLAPGETRTQVFKAAAVPEAGRDYFNEFSVIWSNRVVGSNNHCKNGGSDGMAVGIGGAGATALVMSPMMFDIEAVSKGGSIRARVVYYPDLGTVDVLSWQRG